MKHRVLLIAESANPQWTSVPLVGWSHSRALAAVADVHLVTQIRNRQAILDAGLRENEDFTAIDSERVAARVYQMAGWLGVGKDKGWTKLMALSVLSYRYFEKLVWLRFRDDLKARRFDVVHRLTPLSPSVPSLMASKCAKLGVPYIWGPINGGVPWPKAFDDARRWEKEWPSWFRNLARLLPGYWRTRNASTAILVASEHTWRQMPERYLSKCVYLPENAIDPGRFSIRRTGPYRRPLRMIFVGRLIPLKGCDMIIEAAADLLRAGDMQLVIVGDGPQRHELEAQTRQLGVEHAVQFRGQIPHTQVQHELASSDLFVFPSIREFGGGVVVEAMAVGVVPIVVDYAGPAEIVTPDTGYLIPLGTRPQIVDRLKACLTGLADQPEALADVAERAQHRVASLFTWPVRAGQVVQVYDWVLGRRNDKPSFDFGRSSELAACAQGEALPV
jgi:glycosyltransferase involved in cell wall biosynthesis